jgi:hypothetical protein
MRSFGLALAIAAAHAVPSRADVTPDATASAMPCRPTIACQADFVPAGVLELEAGYIYRRLGNGADENGFPFLLKLTLIDRLQLQVGTNGATFITAPSQASYFDNATVGLKLHFHDQSKYVPSLSVSATLSVPTFEAMGYVRAYDALFTAYITKDIGRLHVDWNVGFDAWRIDGSPLAQAWTALALSTSLPHSFGAMLESYYFSDASPLSAEDAGVLIAGGFQPKKRIVIDAGVDIGLVHATRDVSAFVGMTLILGELWRQ